MNTRAVLIFLLGVCVTLLVVIFTRPLNDPESTANMAPPKTAGAAATVQQTALSRTAVPPANVPIDGVLPPLTGSEGKGRSSDGFEDESLFVMQGYPGSRPEAVGPASEALVSVAGGLRKLRLHPNQNGEFQRVYLPLGGSIEAKVKMKRPAGEKVAVSVRDGGLLTNGKNAELAQIGADGCVHVTFKTEGYQGIHRVTLTAENGETATLDLWAGAELAVARTSK